MAWNLYEVVFRIMTPLHIGWAKLGSLQRTRPYVTGRVLWGSLTMRLVRNKVSPGEAADNSALYKNIGEKVNNHMAFTYFFPALFSEGTYRSFWPWEEEGLFRFRFLSSYMGSALSYPENAAAYGTLHETEFISNFALDSGEPVFLKGYIFKDAECDLLWKETLNLLQFGGERGYGWGRVKLENISEVTAGEGKTLFDKGIKIDLQGERPLLTLQAEERILAHALAEGSVFQGEFEPLVGREWRSGPAHNNGAGQHVEYKGVYYLPGSKVIEEKTFQIGPFGLWEEVDGSKKRSVGKYNQ